MILSDGKEVTPSIEQLAIMDAARTKTASLMIKAYAGTAKTTTMEMTARVMPVRPSLYVVFNTKNKKEADKRMPTHFNCKTANGLGHEAFGRTIGKRLAVDDNKIADLLKKVLAALPEYRDMPRDHFGDILSLVKRAKISGLVPHPYCDKYPGLIPDDDDGWEALFDFLYMEPDEAKIYLAKEVLLQSIKMAFEGTVDYADQIYMSALFGGVFTRYPLVMVDEAQDLSPLNHIQIKKAAADRLIVVGDPRQAIYAFRGADSASMEKLRDLREDWLDLPLTLTFRCPKVVVARQQKHAPGFTAAESNVEGELHRFQEWDIEQFENLASNGEQIAILCRNNAPLLSAALRIIKSGRGCTVMGKEIGKTLVSLSKKLIPNDNTSIEDCAARVTTWATKELALAEANRKEGHAAVIQDKRECLLAVLESPLCSGAASLRDLLGRMFAGDNLRITLATGHKAKGLEWSHVLHLDPWRVPSKYAIAAKENGNPVPYEQDCNLGYVIETRTKSILILADLEKML
jgi:DNA helicase II / ATP-dependent DNA helicase PcrA